MYVDSSERVFSAPQSFQIVIFIFIKLHRQMVASFFPKFRFYSTLLYNLPIKETFFLQIRPRKNKYLGDYLYIK